MLSDSNEQHEAIIRHIDCGNPDGAAKAFMDHVLFGKQRLIDQLEE
jgi:DNA-binding GntR family transcriptional regulator